MHVFSLCHIYVHLGILSNRVFYLSNVWDQHYIYIYIHEIKIKEILIMDLVHHRIKPDRKTITSQSHRRLA